MSSEPSVPHAAPGTALLLDAAGTLLHPARPIADSYADAAARYGTVIGADEVARRFPAAFSEAAPLRRGAADWRGFWARVVARSTGNSSPALLDDLIHEFARAGAWRVAAGAEACCVAVRARGMKVAVVSNWDHHLRPLLLELGVDWIDALVISGEEGIEKPDPAMFTRACAALGVAASRAVHVGDDRRADLVGARSAGCAALLIGDDVADFEALAERLLRG